MRQDYIQQLIQEQGLDVSGKWMSRDKVEDLLRKVVLEAARLAETAEPWTSHDLIKSYFGVHDE